MRTGDATIWSEDPTDFDLIEDISDQMSRSEMWYLEYRRDPYLRTLPVERLRVLFNRCVAVTSLTFIKGSWPKPPREETEQSMRFFTHLIEETNRRGLDMRDFARDKLTSADKAQVYSGLPAELVKVLDPAAASSG
jgi:hypothetical protein